MCSSLAYDSPNVRVRQPARAQEHQWRLTVTESANPLTENATCAQPELFFVGSRSSGMPRETVREPSSSVCFTSGTHTYLHIVQVQKPGKILTQACCVVPEENKDDACGWPPPIQRRLNSLRGHALHAALSSTVHSFDDGGGSSDAVPLLRYCSVSVGASKTPQELKGRTVPRWQLRQYIEPLQVCHSRVDARQACVAEALSRDALRQSTPPQLLHPSRPAAHSHRIGNLNLRFLLCAVRVSLRLWRPPSHLALFAAEIEL